MISASFIAPNLTYSFAIPESTVPRVGDTIRFLETGYFKVKEICWVETLADETFSVIVAMKPIKRSYITEIRKID